jgi:ferredoxin-NADP reductase
MKIKVIANAVGPDSTTRVLVTTAAYSDIAPGAGVELTVDGVTRPFSFYSSPGSERWVFLLREVPGGEFSSRVAKLSQGDELEANNYFRFFVVEGVGTEDAPVYAFATGVGIAPFASGIKSGKFVPTKLFYGAKTQNDLAMDRDLSTTNFEFYLSKESTPASIRGRVDQAVTPDIIHPNARYFLCGLDEMVSTVSAKLIKLGARYEQISSELFYMKG